jgi:O-acetylhomoserine/O-acetylserine sulfhydrylase-like pyridoxal-dependent enzyme
MRTLAPTPDSVPDLLGTIEAPVFQTAAFTYASAEEMADVFAGRTSGHLYTRLTISTANPESA